MDITEKDIAEFAIEAGIKGVSKAVVSRIVAYCRGPETRLREMEAIEARSWRARRNQEVEQRLATLEGQAKDSAEFRTRTEAMVDDLQFFRMHRNLEFEAIRETLDERRAMLAAAAGGLSDPNMSIEDKARVERALRGVDPVDVKLLAQLDDHDPSNAPTPSVPERAARELVERAPLSGVALMTSGCIVEDNTWGDPYKVTALGKLVLQVLTPYLQGTPDTESEASG